MVFCYSTNSSAQDLEPTRNIEDLKKEVIFYSDKMTTINKSTIILENKVLLIYKDFTLESDYLLFDMEKGQIKAKGNVRAINGDIQVLCDEIEVDTFLESVKIKSANVNLNKLYSFQAKDIFVIKGLFSINGFRFNDNDTKHPIRYSVLVDQLNIFPFYNNKYFYLQINDVNGSVFNWEKLSPLSFPSYSLFVRNPTIPKNYLYQRRIRGYFQAGSFFVNGSLFDSYRGPSASITTSYFNNDYSTGYFTAEYGLYSKLNLSLYHDLTDNNGNLAQLSASYEQYDRVLKKSNVSGDLTLLHDWKYDTLGLRVALNQTYGTELIQRLPEFYLSSIFRVEKYTGLSYRYNIDIARFLLTDNKNKTTNINRLKFNVDLNSPNFYLKENIYLQLLTNTLFYYSFDNNLQSSFAGQIELNHELTNFLNYSVSYRQRFTKGKNLVDFENLTNNRFAGLQINYRLNDAIEFAGFTEFDLNTLKLSNVDFITNYNTDYYQTSFLLNIDLYNIFGVNLRANFKLKDY
ncbi:MAG: hypothetical protein H7263_06720 [Candidatus Sericytochromatia bacterium]|nr:hypothetical protein [Candidatus Sericytochromatia bacterium]